MFLKKIVCSKRYLFIWMVLLLIVLYMFSALINFSVFKSIIAGTLPGSLAIRFFLESPLNIFYNSTPLVSVLFFVNAILFSFYITILLYAISQQVVVRKKSIGIFSSILSVLGAGCITCGSLLTPLLLGVSSFVPLTLLIHLNTLVSGAATVILLALIVYTIQKINKPLLCH